MKRKKKKGYVYLISGTETPNLYKIGVTRGDINKRIKKLQTGNPGELWTVKYYETDYPFFLEKQLHFRLRARKVYGEWFDLPIADALNFENMCNQIEQMIEGLKDNEFFMKNLK